MKNINIRVDDWLKDRVEEIAKEKEISVTEFVTDVLKNGLDPAVISLRLPKATALQLRQAANNEGMPFGAFIEGALRIYLHEQGSVLKPTPSTVDWRRRLSDEEIFGEGRELVLE